MPPESFSGHTEAAISTARTHAEAFLEGEGSALGQLKVVANTLATTTEGKTELLRMQRVALFVCGPQQTAPKHDTMSFIYGELAAQNLLGHLVPAAAAGSHAHEFLKYRMEDARLGSLQDIAQGHWPTVQEEHRNQEALAAQIRGELCGEHGVLPDAYEQHLDHLLDLIDTPLVSAHHFSMGFRIALQEFHAPSHREDYDLVMEATAAYATTRGESPLVITPPEPTVVEFPSAVPALEITTQAPTVDELRTLLQGSGELKLESLSEVRRILVQHLRLAEQAHAFRNVGEDDEATKFAIRRLQEERLRALNRERALLTKGDLIFAHGEQSIYVRQDDQDSQGEWVSFTAETRIQGAFDTLTVVNAPLTDPPSRHLQGTTLSPALQLINPTFFVNGHTIHQEGVTIEVPLLYDSVTLERLAAHQFDD